MLVNVSDEPDLYWGFDEFGNINRTSLSDEIEWPLWEQVLGIAYYLFISVLGIGGNIFIFYAVEKVKHRSTDRRTLLIIKYLAFIDLLSSIVLYPNFIILVYTKRYIASATYCKILGIFEIYFPTTSTFLVLTMVAAKVQMLRDPFRSLSEKKHWIHSVCIVICLIGLLIPSAPFYNLATYIYDPKRATCTFDFYPDWNDELPKFLFVTFATVFCCVVPLLAIAGLSVYIIRKVKKVSSHQQRTTTQKTKSSRKSVLVVLLVVLAYAVTWAPFFVVFTIALFFRTEAVIPRSLLFWPKASLMTNNAVNPIVYVYSNTHIKRVFMRSFMPYWSQRQSSSEIGNRTEVHVAAETEFDT